jgi:hypothetical protein
MLVEQAKPWVDLGLLVMPAGTPAVCVHYVHDWCRWALSLSCSHAHPPPLHANGPRPHSLTCGQLTGGAASRRSHTPEHSHPPLKPSCTTTHTCMLSHMPHSLQPAAMRLAVQKQPQAELSVQSRSDTKRKPVVVKRLGTCSLLMRML